MLNLTLDIETIPNQNEQKIAELRGSVSAPKTMSKPETIAKWFAENGEEAGNDEVKKTSFNGGLGQIFCIGYKSPHAEVRGLKVEDLSLEAEKDMLIRFYADVKQMLEAHETPFFIGHNISEFDLKFIFHRSVIHNIKPAFLIPWNDAPWKGSYFDTMTGWAGNRNTVSLDKLCGYLGIPSSKDGIDGSKVWEYVQAGRGEEVFAYCKKDVVVTEKVYERLTFQGGTK